MSAKVNTLAAVDVIAPRASSHERPQSAAQSTQYQLAVLQSPADLDGLMPEWLALEVQCSGALFFQSAGWVKAVCDFEAARSNAGFAPVIVTLRQDGVLRAVLPLERVQTRLRSLLVPLGDRYSQVSDVTMHESLDPPTALQAMLDAALAAAPVDAVSFAKVRAGSRLDLALRHAVKTGEADGAPYEDLGDWTDFDDYLLSIRAKTRKNLRSSHNRLNRSGKLEHHVYLSGEALQETVTRTLNGRAGRLEELGLTSRAFSDPDFGRFCASLAAHPNVRLMAMSLTLDGEPLSEQWGFVHNGRYYIFMTTRDFQSSEESPGKLHMREVMGAAFGLGISTVDFMSPVMPYKVTWCRKVSALNDFALPVTWRGKLVVHVWDKLLRRLAKRAFTRLPAGFRQAVMRRISG